MEALGGVFQERAGNSLQGRALRTPSLLSSDRVHPLDSFSLPSSPSQPLQVLQQARILPQDTPNDEQVHVRCQNARLLQDCYILGIL